MYLCRIRCGTQTFLQFYDKCVVYNLQNQSNEWRDSLMYSSSHSHCNIHTIVSASFTAEANVSPHIINELHWISNFLFGVIEGRSLIGPKNERLEKLFVWEMGSPNIPQTTQYLIQQITNLTIRVTRNHNGRHGNVWLGDNCFTTIGY
jgi:hypothetical protein